MGNLCHVSYFSPLSKVLFLHHCFQDFLSLVFRSLTMIYLGTNFFGLIVFCIYSPSCICKFMSCQIWETFSHYFFTFFFFSSLTFFLLSFWSNDTIIRFFCYSPKVPKALFIFFSSLFSLCWSYWVTSIFKFTDSFLCLSILLLSPYIEFLILVILFFSSKISMWWFLISSILYWDPIFSTVLNVFVIACWSIFIMAT